MAQPVGLSPAFTPLHTGFTPTTESRSQLELGTPEYRLSATYSELTGQPTPTASRALDTTLAPPVSAPTAIVPSSVASSEPVVPAAPPPEPVIATVTEAVASTSLVLPSAPQGQITTSAPESQQLDPVTGTAEQTQTAPPPATQSEGQPESPQEAQPTGQAVQSSDSNVDLAQFELTPHTSVPDSSAPVPPADP